MEVHLMLPSEPALRMFGTVPALQSLEKEEHIESSLIVAEKDEFT